MIIIIIISDNNNAPTREIIIIKMRGNNNKIIVKHQQRQLKYIFHGLQLFFPADKLRTIVKKLTEVEKGFR